MEDVRALVPRMAPSGMLEQPIVSQLLDVHLMLIWCAWEREQTYEMALMDEPPRKIKVVKAQCSMCGETMTVPWHGEPRWAQYGYIDPVDQTPVHPGQSTLCPHCRCPVRVMLRSELGCGYAVADTDGMTSASVVGSQHYLVLSCWMVERRVWRDAHEEVVAMPDSAYVFGPDKQHAKLVGSHMAYSGTAGYFRAFKRSWSQPQRWSETWGECPENIYGLTQELIADSCLPDCKLPEYMASFPDMSHKYPVAYLRAYQEHPEVENLLVSGPPMILHDLLDEQMDGNHWGGNVRGLPKLDGIIWDDPRPAQMLGLTKDELRMGREQCWGAYFWRLFVLAKQAGDRLTAKDMILAFQLGDENLIRLVGVQPVGKCLRYMMRQIEKFGPWADPDIAYNGVCIDTDLLMDYWEMCAAAGRDLADPHVRWPRDLMSAHEHAVGYQKEVNSKRQAVAFRARRKALSKYIFEADGLVIFPAGSQKDLDKEAVALAHCVWSYGEKHATGQSAIFFIRRSIERAKPFYTLEFDETNCSVLQNRGHHNCARTQEVSAFENKWISWVRDGAPRDKEGMPILRATQTRKIG